MASGIEKYIIDRKDYTSLVPTGIDLPDWFYNVKPVDFYDGVKEQLSIEQAEQQIESNRRVLEAKAEAEEYEKRQAEAIKGEKDLDVMYEKLIGLAQETGNPTDIRALSKERASLKPKEKEPTTFIRDGYAGLLYPDGTIQIKSKLPERQKASPPPRAESEAPKKEKPKSSSEQVLEAMEALLKKSEAETQSRAIKPKRVLVPIE